MTDQLALFDDPDEIPAAADANARALASASRRAADMRAAEELHRVITSCIQRAARGNGWTGPDEAGHMIPPPQPPPKPKAKRPPRLGPKQTRRKPWKVSPVTPCRQRLSELSASTPTGPTDPTARAQAS